MFQPRVPLPVINVDLAKSTDHQLYDNTHTVTQSPLLKTLTRSLCSVSDKPADSSRVNPCPKMSQDDPFRLTAETRFLQPACPSDTKAAVPEQQVRALKITATCLINYQNHTKKPPGLPFLSQTVR